MTRREQLIEAARGYMEQHLGDVAPEHDDEDQDQWADSIFDEAYTLAHDGAVRAGASMEEARDVAQEVAQCIAQP